MAEDLQSLLEKINRDGLEKAEAESAKIIAAARAKADEIVKTAKSEADALRAASAKDAEDNAKRAEETIRQAARDTIRKIEASVTALLEKLLAKDVDLALADEKTAVGLAAGAIKDITGTVEIAANAKLAAALKAQLAATPAITIVTDETLGTGFTVKQDGGRIEHAFTGAVIAEELAKRLRPDLAKLLK